MLNSLAARVRRLFAPEALRPYASITEQILMSGSNMFASLIVVKAAGVTWFGIYSFVFVLTTLANGAFATLLHRQMMLEISAATEEERSKVFLATFAIEVLFMAIAVSLFAGVLWLAGDYIESADLEKYSAVIIASIAFVCLYNLFDLCRQFLYTTDNQIYSLRCTVIYVLSQGLMLLWILFQGDEATTVANTYLAFTASLIISLGFNGKCLNTISDAKWFSWRYAWSVFLGYFQQGRFGLIGMTVTWIQNQGMSPFLMVVSGPLVVGYFSLARLMVMPMAVVSQGLVNSTTPGLRRTYKRDGVQLLKQRITSLSNKNLLFSVLYVTILAIAHIGGMLTRFVPSYAEVQWFLLLWIMIMTATMYRFWIGQFFVVSMRFRFMLYVSLSALLVSLSGMLGFGLGLGNVKLALMFVVVGELVTIFLFLRERRKVLNETESEN
ncbi:MAG: hypothetical protein V3U76_13735 [Granulosicoccus sp.]